MWEVRWAGGLICVYCGSSGGTKRDWKKQLYQRYKCKDCGRFNGRTGTAMDHSRLPLRFWFSTAFIMQPKVSVKEVAETRQRPYATSLGWLGI